MTYAGWSSRCGAPGANAPSSDAESARAEIVSLLAAVSGSSITIVRTSAPSNLGEAETVVSNTTGSASSIITPTVRPDGRVRGVGRQHPCAIPRRARRPCPPNVVGQERQSFPGRAAIDQQPRHPVDLAVEIGVGHPALPEHECRVVRLRRRDFFEQVGNGALRQLPDLRLLRYCGNRRRNNRSRHVLRPTLQQVDEVTQ